MTEAVLKNAGHWCAWARRHGERRFYLLVSGCATESDAESELQRITNHWPHKDTYVTDSGRDPNVRNVSL